MLEIKRPKIVPKVWGYEEHIVNSSLYCQKKLTLLPNGMSSSLHYHKLKTETFFILCGELQVELYDSVDAAANMDNAHRFTMQPDDVLTLEIGTPHRFWAIDKVSQFMESSTQDFPEDSIRLVLAGPRPS